MARTHTHTHTHTPEAVLMQELSKRYVVVVVVYNVGMRKQAMHCDKSIIILIVSYHAAIGQYNHILLQYILRYRGT